MKLEIYCTAQELNAFKTECEILKFEGVQINGVDITHIYEQLEQQCIGNNTIRGSKLQNVSGLRHKS